MHPLPLKSVEQKFRYFEIVTTNQLKEKREMWKGEKASNFFKFISMMVFDYHKSQVSYKRGMTELGLKRTIIQQLQPTIL